MKIVATSLAHDSSACFLEDGKIKYFNKQERLSRIKRDALPFLPLLEIDATSTSRTWMPTYRRRPFRNLVTVLYRKQGFSIGMRRRIRSSAISIPSIPSARATIS